MRRLVFVASETALLLIVGLASAYLRLYSDAEWELYERGGWIKLLLMSLAIQLTFHLFDMYELRVIRRYYDTLLALGKSLGLAAVLVSVLYYIAPVLSPGRGVVLINIALVSLVMAAWRLGVVWAAGHPQLGVRERLLILGSGEEAIEVARATLERKGAGFHIVGFVDNKPELLGRSLINPAVIGLTPDLGEIVESHQIDRIVVAVEDRRGQLPVDPLLNLSLSGRVAVEESACYYERLTGKIATETLRPSWLIFSRGSRYSDITQGIRRVLNASLAGIGLLLSLPLMALVAMAVKLDSNGPVFYAQERVGKNGRRFRILKFRSMEADAEESSGPKWAQEKDPRVTRVGRIIRRLRLDELPQFFNIIRGDMNFVGPRPERPVFVEQLSALIPYYSQRHLVKPGLTGWAQIKFPYGSSVQDAVEKLRYDLYYIKNQTLILDAVIILETVKTVLFGRGGR